MKYTKKLSLQVREKYAANNDKKKVASRAYSKAIYPINSQKKKSTSKKYYRAHQNESKSYYLSLQSLTLCEQVSLQVSFISLYVLYKSSV